MWHWGLQSLRCSKSSMEAWACTALLAQHGMPVAGAVQHPGSQSLRATYTEQRPVCSTLCAALAGSQSLLLLAVL